ncbi:MAG: hypothetical protein HXX10_12205 [Rhodoplanes sp.]|uniref:hypothetical protein n=1 Tax=Rhodoplanes sp. TaxID=1968906 RepID=UPI0017AECC01|nr:hypothetical protein [Rhodoplanes sp.]NVO14789.1 hypothetical protein [Rhodoplanes sp.]
MVSKLSFEIDKLMNSQSVWTKSEGFPEPLFIAFNTAVTAWHITDWLWESRQETRALLRKRFKFEFNEWTMSGRDKGLERFQNAVCKDSREIHICREIANASKHMRKRKSDPDVKALAEWLPAIEPAGHVKVGDLVLQLSIYDGEKKWDAVRLFIEAFGYWEQLLREEGLITRDARLPDKIVSP